MTTFQLDQAPPHRSVLTSFPASPIAPATARPLSPRAAVLVWIAASLAGWALIFTPIYFLLG